MSVEVSEGLPPTTRRAVWKRFWPVWLLAVLLAVWGSWRVADALESGDLPGATSADLPDNIGFDQQLNAVLPGDLEFLDSSGRTVRLDEVTGDRPVVLNLVYFECPMLCNMSMDALLRTLNTLSLQVGRDFDVVTVSFDPTEGPALAAAAKRTAVNRYGERDGSPEGWHFLTGEQEAIQELTRAVGFNYEFDEQSGQYAHAAGVMVVTPERRISRYLLGIDFTARDLRLGLVEASSGRIGTPTDQVLLLCYRYDPLQGRYGLAITRAVRVLGLATVLGLVGGIGFMLLHERRQTSQRGGEDQDGIS